MQRFDGAIAGLGTESGVRVVLGMWRETPFGPIADAMVERADGHRVLVAPNDEVARYIGGTYRFDELRTEPVRLHIAGDVRTFVSPSLTVRLEVGRRTGTGRVLSLVPRALARNRVWCRAVDPVARVVRHGVRTVGTAGGGRREWYCATDERSLAAVRVTFDGTDLGGLRPVRPPVRFGFGSTPARPSLVDVTTWIDDGTARTP